MIRRWSKPGRMTPAVAASSSNRIEDRHERHERLGRLLRDAGSAAAGRSRPWPMRSADSDRHRCRGGPADPVVLAGEHLESDERIVLRRDDLVEVFGGRADGLLEQREQQLVLAGEVLVEAPQGLAGAFDDLLDGELLLARPASSARGPRRGSAARASPPGPGPDRGTGPRPAHANWSARQSRRRRAIRTKPSSIGSEGRSCSARVIALNRPVTRRARSPRPCGPRRCRAPGADARPRPGTTRSPASSRARAAGRRPRAARRGRTGRSTGERLVSRGKAAS